MRMLCVLIWIGSSLAAFAGSLPANALRSVWVSGREYINLAYWADVKHLRFDWPRKNEIGHLTNRWARLNFRRGSTRSELNGIAVWLSFPILSHSDNFFISRFDIRNALEPILQPAKSRKPVRLRTVALDPGHGGKDPGTQAGPQQEKEHTLLLAKEIRNRLNRAGLKAALTRSADTFVDLDERPAIAKAQGADLFVSLHYNSVGGAHEGIKGVEVHCLPPAGSPSTGEGINSGDTHAQPGNRNNDRNMLLAYQIQRALVNGLNTDDRGVRRSRFVVLKGATMPAVLVECGFMSDPHEAKRVYSEGYRRQLAQAIVDGILAYKRCRER